MGLCDVIKMAETSGIEWTDASWNPVTGCTKVSAGCLNCYAEELSLRLQKMHPGKKYRNGFKVTLHENDISLPLKWKEPKKIFVNSMSDLFHKDVPFDFIDKIWGTMLEARHHTYQILTKRPERMKEYIAENAYKRDITPRHIWLGTSVEDAKVIHRIDTLRKVSAHMRFISMEPLIGDVGDLNLSGIQWVIVGGESGPKYRPMKEQWAVNIRDQCKEHGVAFFFKQWGGLRPKSGGCLLQGKEYKEYPV